MCCLPATVTASAATRAALRFRTGFVHVQRSTVEIPTVEAADRGITFGIDAHFDKGESARLPGIAIGHDVDALDGAIRIKHGTERIFRRPETEVTYKNILQINFFLNLQSSESGTIRQRAGTPDDAGRCENRRNFKDNPILARIATDGRGRLRNAERDILQPQ
jgi:hypothetical protein